MAILMIDHRWRDDSAYRQADWVANQHLDHTGRLSGCHEQEALLAFVIEGHHEGEIYLRALGAQATVPAL